MSFGTMGFIFALNALTKISKLEKQLTETGVTRHGRRGRGRIVEGPRQFGPEMKTTLYGQTSKDVFHMGQAVAA